MKKLKVIFDADDGAEWFMSQLERPIFSSRHILKMAEGRLTATQLQNYANREIVEPQLSKGGGLRLYTGSAAACLVLAAPLIKAGWSPSKAIDVASWGMDGVWSRLEQMAPKRSGSFAMALETFWYYCAIEEETPLGSKIKEAVFVSTKEKVVQRIRSDVFALVVPIGIELSAMGHLAFSMHRREKS